MEDKPDSDTKSEGLDQEPDNEIERDQATNITDKPIVSQADFELSLSKWAEKLNLELSQINRGLSEIYTPKETKDTNDVEEEKDDNIDAAKIWAKQQKQSLAK